MYHSITKPTVNISSLLMHITIQSHEWQIRYGSSLVYRDQCDDGAEIQNIKLLVSTYKQAGGQDSRSR